MKYTTAELNSQINNKGYLNDVDDSFYENVKNVAEEIKKNYLEKPIILLSGPSGSGKTTTALILEKMLDESGFETHTISMDSYFKSLTSEEAILDAEGKMDFETPKRIDSELLSEQIEKIFRCEEVKIPKFNFKEKMRANGYSSILKRQPKELVIFEGIHALNPEVISIGDDKLAKIYVSVRTRIETESGLIMHPKYIRLLRRMLRDKLFRGRSVQDSVDYFNHVEEGTKKYIMPYKQRADYEIDSFIAYEVNVYKNVLEENVNGLEESEAKKLILSVLSELDGVPLKKVGDKSLIREFTGGGTFKY